MVIMNVDVVVLGRDPNTNDVCSAVTITVISIEGRPDTYIEIYGRDGLRYVSYDEASAQELGSTGLYLCRHGDAFVIITVDIVQGGCHDRSEYGSGHRESYSIILQ